MLTPKSREEMLDCIGIAGMDCAEIGVFKGGFSEKILERRPKSLLMVDPWKNQKTENYPYDEANVSDREFEDIFQGLSKQFGNLDNVTIARDFSYRYATKVPYESLDFAYIDAIHTFDSCLCDVLTWYQKVKPGGWLCGHDYCGKYLGVQYAIKSFIRLTGESLAILTAEEWASWGIHKST